jgi:hypothetical protein
MLVISLSYHDVIKFLTLRYLVESSDTTSDLIRFCTAVGIRITDKDRTRGKPFIIMRLLRSIDTGNFLASIQNILTHSSTGVKLAFPADRTPSMDILEGIFKSSKSLSALSLKDDAYYFTFNVYLLLVFTPTETSHLWLDWIISTLDTSLSVLVELIRPFLKFYVHTLTLTSVKAERSGSKKTSNSTMLSDELTGLSTRLTELQESYDLDIQFLNTLALQSQTGLSKIATGKTFFVFGDITYSAYYEGLIKLLGGTYFFFNMQDRLSKNFLVPITDNWDKNSCVIFAGQDSSEVKNVMLNLRMTSILVSITNTTGLSLSVFYRVLQNLIDQLNNQPSEVGVE